MKRFAEDYIIRWFYRERRKPLVIRGARQVGKSTLVRILAGVYPFGSYQGQILIDNQQQRFRNINDAEKSGVVMIPQELVIAPHRSVAENMFLNNLPHWRFVVDWSRLHRDTQRLLDELHIDVTPTTLMRRLSAGQRQLVLIAKALLRTPRILVLDESAASLPLAPNSMVSSFLPTSFRIVSTGW